MCQIIWKNILFHRLPCLFSSPICIGPSSFQHLNRQFFHTLAVMKLNNLILKAYFMLAHHIWWCDVISNNPLPGGSVPNWLPESGTSLTLSRLPPLNFCCDIFLVLNSSQTEQIKKIQKYKINLVTKEVFYVKVKIC